MSKKILAAILAVGMVLSLTACEGEKHESDKDEALNSVSEEIRDSAETEEETEEETTEAETTVKKTTTAKKTTTTTASKKASGMREEFKEAMDSYEEFYDEYCEFMKEYNQNPSDTDLLMKYADMMAKAAEATEKFEEWDEDEMSEKELAYYTEVNSRVLKKLASVAA